MTRRKPIDTGARKDVVASLKRVRARLVEQGDNDVFSAVNWYWDSYHPCRDRLLEFVLPGYERQLSWLATDHCTHEQALCWLDTVIAHDTREMKARGVL